jgi:thioredoxin reductase (NADPH)
MQERILNNPKIKIVWNTSCTEAYGEKLLTGVVAKNVITGDSYNIDCSGLFYAIGKIVNYLQERS